VGALVAQEAKILFDLPMLQDTNEPESRREQRHAHLEEVEKSRVANIQSGYMQQLTLQRISRTWWMHALSDGSLPFLWTFRRSSYPSGSLGRTFTTHSTAKGTNDALCGPFCAVFILHLQTGQANKITNKCLDLNDEFFEVTGFNNFSGSMQFQAHENS